MYTRAVDTLTSTVIIAIQFWAHYLLRRHGKERLPRPVYKLLEGFIVALWPILIFAIVYSQTRSSPLWRSFPNWIGSYCSAIALIWGATLSVTLPAYVIYRRFLRKADAAGVSQQRRRLVQAAGAAAMAAPFGVVLFGSSVERTAFEVKEIDVPIANLHPDLEGLRIAQLSDLHVSPFLSVRELGRAVDMTNELRPFLTVITGDLISMPGDPLDDTIRALARLRTEHGVLGCLGNHEVYAKVEDYTVEMSARYGMDFLRARNVQVRRGNGVFNVAGVDFQHFDWRTHYIPEADPLLVPGMPNVLLSHNPDVFPTAAQKGFDLTLAGHTHGGQVTVEILQQHANLAKFFTPYVAGLYRTGTRSCYVTAGIGTIGMPVRIGAPPEITLIRLRRA